MTKKKKEIKVEGQYSEDPIPNILIIGGKKYIVERETTKKIDGVEHMDKVIFKRFDEKEYKENLNIVVDALSKRTNSKEILTHILKGVDLKTLKRVVRRIKAKKPIKKQKGCLGFKIGDAYIQLVD